MFWTRGEGGALDSGEPAIVILTLRRQRAFVASHLLTSEIES